MLTSIKQFFNEYIVPQEQEEELPEHALQLATAALLIEMMRMDDNVVVEEQRVVKDILNTRFSLSDDEMARLMALAEEEASGLADYYQFTSLINKNFTSPQKINLVEHF